MEREFVVLSRLYSKTNDRMNFSSPIPIASIQSIPMIRMLHIGAKKTTQKMSPRKVTTRISGMNPRRMMTAMSPRPMRRKMSLERTVQKRSPERLRPAKM